MTLSASPAKTPSNNPPDNLIQVIPFSELHAVYEQQQLKGYVINELIPRDSISIFVGDSGLGKSPLFYQAALCVANGLPFLGYPTQEGTVLYIDLENGVRGGKDLYASLVQHLGLTGSYKHPLWCDAKSTLELRPLLEKYQPSLAIIDSLRSFDEAAPETNEKAAKLLNSLRSLGRIFRTAFVLLHHVKKPSEQKGTMNPQALHDAESILQWLNQASGARALVNQSDVRWGFDSIPNKPDLIIMRGYERIRGEIGPIHVTRHCDDTGEPIGYDRASGVDLLENSEDRELYGNLPDTFSFKEAVQHSKGWHDMKVTRALKRLTSAGLLHPHKPREAYRKVRAR